MSPIWIDHVLVALLVFVVPVRELVAARRLKARIEAGEAPRTLLYRKIIVEEWAATAVLVAIWFGLGRGAAALGLVPRGGTLAIAGYALTIVVCAGLLLQLRTSRTAEGRATLRRSFGSESFLIPRNTRERRAFAGVSLTAGICEEVVYRGFMIAYLTALPGVSLAVAVVLSSIAFGLVHAYQGTIGVVRVTAVGLGLGLLFGLTGSLWAPIAAHITMDLVSGRLGYLAFADSDPESDSQPQAA